MKKKHLKDLLEGRATKDLETTTKQWRNGQLLPWLSPL